jgi:M6 family metalloprotease-like protein
MTIRRPHQSLIAVSAFGLFAFSAALTALRGADRSPPPPPKADIGVKASQTVETAPIDALSDAASIAHQGYLGVSTEVDTKGRLIVQAVAPNSPALKCGIQTGDVLVKVDGKSIASTAGLRKLLQAKSAGDKLKLAVRRGEKELELSAGLAALGDVGRKPAEKRAVLGVRTSEPRFGDGERVDDFTPDSPAEKAGLKVGDLLLKVDGAAVGGSTHLVDILADKKPGDTVKIVARRDAKQIELKAELVAESLLDRGFTGRGNGRGGFRGRRGPTLLQPGVLKVAVVGIEFPDVKRNDKITPKDWENEFFSRNLYSSTNVTGQQVYGSVNDYYLEQSSGTMRVEGKMLGWVEVAKNRMDYSPVPTPPVPATNDKRDEKKKDDEKKGEQKPAVKSNSDKPNSDKPNAVKPNADNSIADKSLADKSKSDKPGAEKGATDKPRPDDNANRFRSREAVLREALDKLIARDGKDALDGYDAVIFIYAGKRAVRTIDSVYWPHMAMMNYQGRRLRHYVVEEGGDRMTNISVLCHEMGHIFGLPDLYIRRQQNGSPNPPRFQNPYAESLWQWDVMAVQVNSGRPQHMSAWSKEQLGWLKPSVIDSQVPQKLVLAPIENSPTECIKIPVRADGSEYFLLENRRHIGFDASVPAEGLLIWRVAFGRPVLEAAHGVSGSAGLRRDTANVPFPTDHNDAFTPYTRPSSAALTGEEIPVFITHIRRLPDGRIAFDVGYGFD